MMFIMQFAWLILIVIATAFFYIIYRILFKKKRVPDDADQLQKMRKEMVSMYSYDDLQQSLESIQRQRQQAEIDYENVRQNVQYDTLMQQYQREHDTIIKDYYRKKEDLDKDYYKKDTYHNRSASLVDLAVGSLEDTYYCIANHWKANKDYSELLNQYEDKLATLKQTHDFQTMDNYKIREHYSDIQSKIDYLEQKKSDLHGFGAGRKKALIDRDLEVLYKDRQTCYKEIQNRGFDTVAEMDKYFESSKTWQSEIKQEWDSVNHTKVDLQHSMKQEVALSIPIIQRYEKEYIECIKNLSDQERNDSQGLKSYENAESRIESLDREIREMREKINNPTIDIREKMNLEKEMYSLEQEKETLESKVQNRTKPKQESVESVQAKLGDAKTKLEEIQNFKNRLKPFMTHEQKIEVGLEQQQQQQQSRGMSM